MCPLRDSRARAVHDATPPHLSREIDRREVVAWGQLQENGVGLHEDSTRNNIL